MPPNVRPLLVPFTLIVVAALATGEETPLITSTPASSPATARTLPAPRRFIATTLYLALPTVLHGFRHKSRRGRCGFRWYGRRTERGHAIHRGEHHRASFRGYHAEEPDQPADVRAV